MLDLILLIAGPATYSGNPLIQSPMRQTIGGINEGFFLNENVWRFLTVLPGGQKSGRNNEVTVIPKLP